jgi:hypothetical protein
MKLLKNHKNHCADGSVDVFLINIDSLKIEL